MPGKSRRSSGGARKRNRTDWVYNERSYATATSTLVAGTAGALAFPLTISQNTRRVIVSGSAGVLPGLVNYQSGAALPEGSKQRVHAVEASFLVAPTTWAATNEFRIGFRLLHGEQETATQDLLVHVDYSMFNSTTMTPSQFANAGFLREWRFAEGPLSGTVIAMRGQFVYNLLWRSQKGITLGNDRAMFVYVESAIASTSVRLVPYCRTLLEVSGQP